MKPMLRKTLTAAMVLALTVPLATACTKANKKDTEATRTLRIATTMYGGGDDNEYFRQQFTEIFEFANPNIKLEFIPTMDDRFRYGPGPKPGEKMPDPNEKLKEAMQGANPPDLVMVDYGHLPELIGSNLLAPLDPLIQKDKLDTSDIVPAVMEGIKAAAPDGKLYALSPLFTSSAVIYNKKLFEDAGVSFPKDGMTWQEMFDLGKRVAKPDGDKPIYGFNFNTNSNGGDMTWSTQIYSQPLQLRMWDDKGEKMTVDSDQWEKVWSTMIQLQKDKVMPEAIDYSQPGNQARRVQPDQNSPFAYDDFMSGKLAMAVINYGWLPQLINANKNASTIQNYTPIEWDVVSMPSHPEAPGVGGQIYMNGIMGINVKAQNPQDAWKFIQFINGEEWARLKSHSSYQLVSRKKYITPPSGATFNVPAFYTTKPAPINNSDYKIARDMPNIYAVQSLGQQNFMQAVQGKMSVRDALKKWQTDGDAMLKQMKENPTGPIGPNGISAEK